jgi:hypothetical protein
MAVTPWVDEVKNRKVLTIFPTKKVTDNPAWLQVFKDAIAEFNKISTDAAPNLGVTFASPPDVKRPDPVGEDGAEVQFDLGNGKLEYEAVGQKFVATDSTTKQPINFSPTALHGYTEQLKLSSGGPFRVRRAFIFVPATPMIGAAMRVGKGPDDFRTVQRLAGSGVRLYIAVHEMIHACGLSNSEHTFTGPDADTFTINPDTSAGAFDRPQDDKILLRVSFPNPNVTAPPNFIKKTVADLIRNNWK